MRIIDRILGAAGLQRKQSFIGSLLSLLNLGAPVWTPRQYDKFAEEGYQKNVVAFSCIREISKSAASVQWILYRKRGGRKMEIMEHPLLDILRRPNPLQGGAAFMETVYGFFMIAGNSYIEAVGPDRRPPVEIYAHRPDRIKVIPGKFGLPQGFEYTVSGQKKIWDVDPITGKSPVLQLKTFNPLNDWYGMSPIEAAAYAIDTHNQAEVWNKALLDNGARPSGALVAAGNLTEEQFKRLKTEVDEKYSGAKNAGKPLLVEGGLDWKEMGFSPKDMDFIESKRTSARDITLAFGVPPMLLGIPGDNTYSNQKEARLAFWEQTVVPLVNLVRDEFNNWLTPAYGDDLWLDYDEDRISALSPRRESVWEKVKNADFLTINEKREAVGYEPVYGGDEVFISIALLPLGFGAGGSQKSTELKLVNDSTPEKRAREWAIQVRIIEGLERGFTERMAGLLKDQAERSAKAFRESGLQGVEISLQDHARKVGEVLTAHYSTVMKTSGKRVLEGLKSSSGGYESKNREDLFERFLTEWIGKNTARRTGDISTETRNRIIRAISAGEAEGESVAKIADSIVERTGGEIALARAATIARTETHSAATAANDGAAAATGLNLKRSWITAKDEKTRDSHLEAEGQVRGMDEPFDVGGAKLMRPGDPDGPAAEIINCRCVVTYIVPEA